MREIKFRAWDKDAGRWLTDEEISKRIMINPYIGTSGKFQLDEEIPNGLAKDLGWSIELMQYTGLKDKNGKEIYEGYIVKQIYHAERGSYDDPETYDGHHVGEVIITASKGVCMKYPLCSSEETDETTRSNQYKNVAGYRCEIIGNRFENPELLGEVE